VLKENRAPAHDKNVHASSNGQRSSSDASDGGADADGSESAMVVRVEIVMLRPRRRRPTVVL
jgi:hypothetical protein